MLLTTILSTNATMITMIKKVVIINYITITVTVTSITIPAITNTTLNRLLWPRWTQTSTATFPDGTMTHH